MESDLGTGAVRAMGSDLGAAAVKGRVGDSCQRSDVRAVFRLERRSYRAPVTSESWHLPACRAAARHVREQCYIPRAEAGAGPGSDDPYPVFMTIQLRPIRGASA